MIPAVDSTFHVSVIQLARRTASANMFRVASRVISKAGVRSFSTAASAARPRALVGAAAAAVGIAAGYTGYANECLKIEIDDATAKKLLAALSTAAPAAKGPRYNELMPSPANPAAKVCVVEFNIPGAKNGGTDKGPNGHRIDSIPIANGVIKAGGACEILKYYDTKHAEFAKVVMSMKYDALIVRINPGQLSQKTLPGTQERFDALMNDFISKGGIVWSSPDVQTKMGAKDALVKIANMGCGLRDTLAYYTAEDLISGFKKTCAFQPRVIKQNRGSAGEGIWLCWLCSGKYCKTYGEKSLTDGDYLKLMEMNDNHIEYHTVGEFLEFCLNGPDSAKAGTLRPIGRAAREATRRGCSYRQPARRPLGARSAPTPPPPPPCPLPPPFQVLPHASPFPHISLRS